MPTRFPASLTFLDWRGARTVETKSEDQYYGLIFWYWNCRPCKPNTVYGHETTEKDSATALS